MKYLIPLLVLNGYKTGYSSVQRSTYGWLSKGPIDGWSDHGGEVSGNCSRINQSNPCNDCGIIEVENEAYKHASEQSDLFPARDCRATIIDEGPWLIHES